MIDYAASIDLCSDTIQACMIPLFRCHLVSLLALVCLQSLAFCDEPWSCVLPEQRAIQVRSPGQLCSARIPDSVPPATVANPQWDDQPLQLSLSDVLSISLQNMDVVRVLTGVNATTTGRTIFDPAIANTGIDAARGAFDPTLFTNNNWLDSRTPTAIPDTIDPTQSRIVGNRNDLYGLNAGLSKRMVTGGVIDFGVIGNQNRFPGLVTPLNPQLGTSTAIQLTQPLLQGAGRQANQAPIVIARIDTERSYFQFKDSVQNHLLSVIQGYWQLVLARTELWAREQQVAQLEFALRRAEDSAEIGVARLGEAAQARVSYENFRAILLVAQANVLQRESALRNAMGLSPYDNSRLIPTSALIDQAMQLNWDELLRLAELRRPDVIELKLILEADQQRMLLRNNEALPRLDAVALYRWNGLEGTMPNGTNIGQAGFDDWGLGVNFSVPIGLRSSRALLRQQELLIQRDLVNLQQGLHQASHNLAINVRNLDLFYAQYQRYQEVRKAAQINLDAQIAIGNQLDQFIVLLQAIVDWGNSIANEAQALVLYNSELAALERETGTIVEANGIAFVEERFGSVGPLGRLALPVAYPQAVSPRGVMDRYPGSEDPSERQFNLENPLEEYQQEEDSQSNNGSDDSPHNATAPEPQETSSRQLRRSALSRTADRIKNFMSR